MPILTKEGYILTKDQVELIKTACLSDDGTGNPVAKVFTILFNDEISFRNTDDFVIWDDENELVSVIRQNFDGPVQGAAWPYKISTGFFGNIQFLEGLYDMGSFEKIIDSMFLNTGLIDEAKKEMIMKWAKNVRNHALVPKAPGPYYPTCPSIPPKPPVPEIRPDGIFHASPIDQRTKKNMIFKMVDAMIEAATDFEFKKVRPATYEVSVFDMTAMAEQFKAFYEGVGADLFYGSLTDNDSAAIYNPKIQESIDNFVDNAIDHVLPDKKGTSRNIVMYIEAYGVRVRYDFLVKYEDDAAADEKWMTETTASVLSYVESINDPAVDSIVINGDYSFSAVINTTSDLDIGLTDFLYTLDGVKTVSWNANGRTYTLVAGDESSKENFKKGVVDSMPTQNEETLDYSVTIMSDNNATLQYTLKVKYYNEETAAAKVGDTYYTLLANAVANAPSGETINVMNDVNESIVVPEGKTLTLNLGGHTITNATGSDTITNNGTLTIDGTGTVDNVSHGKAAIMNNGTMTILNGSFTRSMEAGTSAGSNNNSYYAVLNHGDMTIGAEGVDNSGIAISAIGGHSSLVSNGWYDSTGKTPENDTCTMTIYGGTFNGGKYNLKNDELGIMTVKGGTFTGADDVTTLNWHEMTIDDGDFTTTKSGLVNVSNGTYGQGVGKAIINGGTFTTVGSTANIGLISGYGSEDITINGGTFSCNVNLEKYLGENREIDSESVPGKYVVVTKSNSEVVDEDVNTIIEGLSTEGVTVETDPDTPNTYNITTNGAMAIDGLIDQVVAIENVTSVTITDGQETATYNLADGDLAAFKAAVDAMMPTTIEQGEVTLTMTVAVA